MAKNDMKNTNRLDDLVNEYLPKFQTCSQTCFYVLNREYGLKADEFVKALASMPGVVFRGETCGAVTGCLTAISLVFEEKIFDERREKLSKEPSNEFCSKFENEYGSTQCRGVVERITGRKYEVNKPEDYDTLARDGVYDHCPGVMKKAVQIASEIISKKIHK